MPTERCAFAEASEISARRIWCAYQDAFSARLSQASRTRLTSSGCPLRMYMKRSTISVQSQNVRKAIPIRT